MIEVVVVCVEETKNIYYLSPNSLSLKKGDFVIFEDENKKILGEIDSILEDTIKITFLGELTDNDFIGGLIKKPSLDAKIRIINEQELRILTGTDVKSLRLGVSPLYNQFPLNVVFLSK